MAWHGRVAVDLHTHTWRSGDSRTTVDRFVAHLGSVQAVAVTDHHDIRAALEIAQLTSTTVIVGEEIDTGVGELIGLYLTDPIPRRLGLIETVQRIRAQGGLVYAPHPLDPRRRSLGEARLRDLVERGDLDIIEAGNGKMPNFDHRAAAIARAHGVPIASASDAHVAQAIGGCAVLADRVPRSPNDLLALLADAVTVWRHIDPVSTETVVVPGS